MQPVDKPDTVRRLAPVDGRPLAGAVARLSDTVWNRESAVRENDFFCFAHTRHIVFRFIHLDETRFCYHVNPGWNLWRRWLLPVMTQAAAPYGYAEPVYPKAMLARLVAGHGIDPHTDGGVENHFTHKIHVPLQTNPRSTLTVAGATFHLEAGYAWEVNNLAPHGAFNGGGQDRIHFIFEVLEGAGQEWRLSRRSSRPSPRPSIERKLPVHLPQPREQRRAVRTERHVGGVERPAQPAGPVERGAETFPEGRRRRSEPAGR